MTIALRDVFPKLRRIIDDEVPDYAKDWIESERRDKTNWKDQDLVDALNAAQRKEALDHRSNNAYEYQYALEEGRRDYEFPPGYQRHVSFRFLGAEGNYGNESPEIPVVQLGIRPNATDPDSSRYSSVNITILSHRAWRLSADPDGSETVVMYYMGTFPELTIASGFQIPDGFEDVVIYRAAIELLSQTPGTPNFMPQVRDRYEQAKGEWFKHGDITESQHRLLSPLETYGELSHQIEENDRL